MKNYDAIQVFEIWQAAYLWHNTDPPRTFSDLPENVHITARNIYRGVHGSPPDNWLAMYVGGREWLKEPISREDLCCAAMSMADRSPIPPDSSPEEKDRLALGNFAKMIGAIPPFLVSGLDNPQPDSKVKIPAELHGKKRASYLLIIRVLAECPAIDITQRGAAGQIQKEIELRGDTLSLNTIRKILEETQFN